jgi:hypothetical protein
VAPRLLVLLAALALAGGASAGRAADPTLTGTDGTADSFQLTLADANGPVSHLAAGTYALVVHDNSELHNFHLFGPGGVDVATTVDTTGVSTFSITLVDGIYTFQCDPHAFSGMRGQFAVGSASLPAPTRKASAAIIGSKATVSGLGAGKVVLTVHDRSKTDGFLLQGPSVSKKTGIAFVGAVSWTVTLGSGTYFWGSVRRPNVRHRISFNP